MSSFTLDAYAARSCPVKTHHIFDPAVVQPALPDDESLRESFQGGTDFRDEVLTQLAATPGAVDLRPLANDADSWEQRELACREAMTEGVAVIISPVLARDFEGHRRGSPDALVRGDDTAEGAPGYWPLRVKPYRVREKESRASSLRFSPLTAITQLEPLPDVRYRVFREGVLLELAHYRKLLEACGHCAVTPLGAVIGNDLTEGGISGATWVDLSAKFIRTFSKSAGHKLRSPLERYEHEHRFRVYVAHQAVARTPEDTSAPVVRPIRVKECDWCPWWSVCRTRIDDDDLSLRISKTPLDVRELQTLLGLGISTVAQLAEADIEEILPKYLPLTGHRDRAEQRLRQAARRARMLAKGVALERISTEPIEVPRSAVELDLDIETADDGTVYLWGVLITDEVGTRFQHFSRFTHLSEDAEIKVAATFAQWLIDFLAEHPDTLVYHYSDYETVHLNRLAQRSGHPALLAATELVKDHFVDLFRYIRDNFVGVDGLGLKVVAQRGAGFTWRDEEPGGLASQSWFNEAVDGQKAAIRDAARKRVLEYNEDDVRATLAVRRWLTEHDSAESTTAYEASQQ